MRIWTGLCGSLFMVGMLTACARVPVGNPNVMAQVKPVSYLSGKNQQQVKRVMGQPVAQRMEEPNQLWSYYDKGCSTLVYFDAQGVCQHAEMRGTCERRLAMRVGL